jgi:hypothetical protein
MPPKKNIIIAALACASSLSVLTDIRPNHTTPTHSDEAVDEMENNRRPATNSGRDVLASFHNGESELRANLGNSTNRYWPPSAILKIRKLTNELSRSEIHDLLIQSPWPNYPQVVTDILVERLNHLEGGSVITPFEGREVGESLMQSLVRRSLLEKQTPEIIDLVDFIKSSTSNEDIRRRIIFSLIEDVASRWDLRATDPVFTSLGSILPGNGQKAAFDRYKRLRTGQTTETQIDELFGRIKRNVDSVQGTADVDLLASLISMDPNILNQIGHVDFPFEDLRGGDPFVVAGLSSWIARDPEKAFTWLKECPPNWALEYIKADSFGISQSAPIEGLKILLSLDSRKIPAELIGKISVSAARVDPENCARHLLALEKTGTTVPWITFFDGTGGVINWTAKSSILQMMTDRERLPVDLKVAISNWLGLDGDLTVLDKLPSLTNDTKLIEMTRLAVMKNLSSCEPELAAAQISANPELFSTEILENVATELAKHSLPEFLNFLQDLPQLRQDQAMVAAISADVIPFESAQSHLASILTRNDPSSRDDYDCD